MLGLQKQRRNAAGGGAWFIAGHLTVFAKLSHHAVPLESRIFSSRCFSFSAVPTPLVSLVVIPLPHIFLSRLPLIRLLSDEGGTPSWIHSRPSNPRPSRGGFAVDFSNFCNRESTNLNARERREMKMCHEVSWGPHIYNWNALAQLENFVKFKHTFRNTIRNWRKKFFINDPDCWRRINLILDIQ